MSIENPLWGAPRIHGELLKLGLSVAQSSVANTWSSRRGRAEPGMDLFVVPTIGFDLLYAYIIVRLDRRELVWISVTTTSDRRNGLRVRITEASRGMKPRAT